MDELEEQQTKSENNEGSEDLSSLVTEKSTVADENLDQMLESASDSSTLRLMSPQMRKVWI